MRKQRRRRLIAACSVAAVVGATTFAIASGSAAGSDRPVISGDPIVGHTLTSSEVATGFGLYKWQSCDPATANCSDSLNHNDPDWTDLTAEDHNGLTYVPVKSDVGHFIRVLIHDNDLGDHWTTSIPVGPVTEEQFLTPPAPPAPQHGVSVLATPVDGSVKVKVPGQNGYTPIDDLTKLPVNTVFDTRGGKVHLTAAGGVYGNETPDQSVEF